MVGLPIIPREITDKVYGTICEFGCVRWKAALKYTEIMVREYGEDFFKEEVLEKADRLAEKTLGTLINEKRIAIKMYAEERLAVPVARENCSFDAMNAFEAYTAVVAEVAENDQCPEFCFASKTSEYPFHFVFAASKQKVLYRVLVFGADSIVRIGYLNNTYNKNREGSYITLLVVPGTYSWEQFDNISIRGKTRIALVEEINPKKKVYECTLTEVLEEP